jgi:hypothetical protein
MSAHPLGRTKEEQLVLGAITRMAMLFDGAGEHQFSGHEVAQILLGAWQSYEFSKDTPVINRFLAQHFPQLREEHSDVQSHTL